MTAECLSGVTSGKLMYPSKYGHVPIYIYLSSRTNDFSFLSSRGSIACQWFTVGGKLSDKNLEQWISVMSKNGVFWDVTPCALVRTEVSE
jgi:hypothetical protein